MSHAGYEAGTDVEERPYRHRVYFRDGDGNEFEFVEYFSDNPAERNNSD